MWASQWHHKNRPQKEHTTHTKERTPVVHLTLGFLTHSDRVPEVARGANARPGRSPKTNTHPPQPVCVFDGPGVTEIYFFFRRGCGMTTQQSVGRRRWRTVVASWRRMTSRSCHGHGTASPPRPLQADTPVNWVTKVNNEVGYRTSYGRFPKRENRSSGVMVCVPVFVTYQEARGRF